MTYATPCQKQPARPFGPSRVPGMSAGPD